jgi:ubiquinone/menaquinone biosynthesis C-methylase UbiE
MTAGDWSSYDTIADRYDHVWGSRFEAVAAFLCERVPLPGPGPASVLDIGTGTGIVLRAMARTSPEGSRLTGCDRSIGMVRTARARLPRGRFVGADATMLPFRGGSFDVVTASFVLSHLPDVEGGLREMARVLRSAGRLVVTSWAAGSDPQGEAWRDLLGSFVSPNLVRAAIERVAPREPQFESPPQVEGTLTGSGFAEVEVHRFTLDYRITLEDYLADRELSSAGRFARPSLGPEAWSRFAARAREVLGSRFGPEFACTRQVLVGVGTRAG